MKLLDLYCGAGGCSVGYNRAGFDVVGVDINPQPNYPFEFIQSDVFDIDESFLQEFDIIHASPPCQAYSIGAVWLHKGGNEYPDLLGPTRKLLHEMSKPYVIENVATAPLLKPMMLCGTMFKLGVIRHRHFEYDSDMWLYPPTKCNHNGTVYGGDYANVINGSAISSRYKGRFMTKEERAYFTNKYHEKIRARYPNASSNSEARYLHWCDAMDIHWVNKQKTLSKNKYDLTQAIPPAYTEWIGKRILKS